MKIAPVLLGAVFAQSSGDSEEVFASDDRWDSWGSDNTFLVNSDEKQYQGTYNGTPKNVQAVTCWESNNMGDLSHFTTQNDDGFGWANIHHGHDQAANSITVTTDDNDYQVGTFVDGQTASSTNKLDLHSLLAYDNRYSGCIYEVADWVYNSNSYNVMWQVKFGADNAGAADGTGLDKSVEATGIRTNWWHYFNAHIVISDDTNNDTNDAKKHSYPASSASLAARLDKTRPMGSPEMKLVKRARSTSNKTDKKSNNSVPTCTSVFLVTSGNILGSGPVDGVFI